MQAEMAAATANLQSVLDASPAHAAADPATDDASTQLHDAVAAIFARLQSVEAALRAAIAQHHQEREQLETALAATRDAAATAAAQHAAAANRAESEQRATREAFAALQQYATMTHRTKRRKVLRMSVAIAACAMRWQVGCGNAGSAARHVGANGSDWRPYI